MYETALGIAVMVGLYFVGHYIFVAGVRRGFDVFYRIASTEALLPDDEGWWNDELLKYKREDRINLHLFTTNLNESRNALKMRNVASALLYTVRTRAEQEAGSGR